MQSYGHTLGPTEKLEVGYHMKHWMIGILLTGVYIHGCYRDKGVPVHATIINAADFALYTITERPDSVHTIQIKDDAGNTYYRDSNPGIDIRQFQFRQMYVAASKKKGGSCIMIHIKPEYAETINRWANNNIGQKAAFIFLNKPVGEPDIIRGGIYGLVTIEMNSVDQAYKLLEELKQYVGLSGRE